MSLAYTQVVVYCFSMMFEMSNTENNFFLGTFLEEKKKSEIVALLDLLSSALKDLAIYV